MGTELSQKLWIVESAGKCLQAYHLIIILCVLNNRKLHFDSELQHR